MAFLPETHRHRPPPSRRSHDFAHVVAQSHAARFDNLWWGFVDTYATPNPFRVVDFGTGPALLVQDLCERFPDAEIFGVDARSDMVARALELLEPFDNAQVIEHDLASPPIPGLDDAQADLVIASMVLHQLPVPTIVLDEAHRVLAPGGVLLVYDWIRHPLSLYAEAALAGERLAPTSGVPPRTEEEFARFAEHCRFTADDYVWLLEQSGFSVHEVLTRREGRRVMIAARRREG